jgi:hypothetical protein
MHIYYCLNKISNESNLRLAVLLPMGSGRLLYTASVFRSSLCTEVLLQSMGPYPSDLHDEIPVLWYHSHQRNRPGRLD